MKHGIHCESDHDPPTGGRGKLSHQRWTIVMRAVQSQAPGGHVSDPAKIDEEIYALRKTLIVCEGEVGS